MILDLMIGTLSPRYTTPQYLNRGGGAPDGGVKQSPPIIIDPPPDDGYGLPKNPFADDTLNATNPISWLSHIANFMSGLMASLMRVENKSTGGITGENPNDDPNQDILMRARILYLTAKMRDLRKAMADQQKEDEEDLKIAYGAGRTIRNAA